MDKTITITIAVAVVVIPVIGKIFIPRLAALLRKKGLDDETRAFIDLIDDYFDEAEAWGDATGLAGAEKLVRVFTSLAEDLGRELTEEEAAVVEDRAARRSKALRDALRRYKYRGLSTPPR